MRREEGRQTPDGDGKLECWIAGRGGEFAASPNKQQASGSSPKRRTTVENRRGELICRDGNQGDCESQQKKSGSGEAPRSKKSARKKARVWCIRRSHSSSRTSDGTLTDNRHDGCRYLGRVAPAKQEIAGCPNQGRRADTHSSHFTGTNVALVLGGCAKRRYKNDQNGQQAEFFQGSSLGRTTCIVQSKSQIWRL